MNGGWCEQRVPVPDAEHGDHWENGWIYFVLLEARRPVPMACLTAQLNLDDLAAP